MARMAGTSASGLFGRFVFRMCRRTFGRVPSSVQLLAHHAPIFRGAVGMDDCVLQSDGGGKVSAARVPIIGAHNVARFLLGIVRKAPPSFQPHRCWVNGTPGLVVTVGDTIDSVMTWAVQEGRVAAVQILRNPEKLAHVHLLREPGVDNLYD